MVQFLLDQSSCQKFHKETECRTYISFLMFLVKNMWPQPGEKKSFSDVKSSCGFKKATYPKDGVLKATNFLRSLQKSCSCQGANRLLSPIWIDNDRAS